MLVICEDCAKKYNIDESKIRGNRARFTCNECGHIIIVDKSDLKRPLVHSTEREQVTSTSTIDLLREMEAPLVSPVSDTEQSQDEPQQEQPAQDAETAPDKTKKKRKKVAWKNLPVPAYFLIGGLVFFILINSAVMYILSQYSSVISLHMQEFQKDILIISILVLVVAWALAFVILFGIGMYVSKSLVKLTKTVNLLNLGDREATVIVQGPEEVANLARILSELSGKLK